MNRRDWLLLSSVVACSHPDTYAVVDYPPLGPVILGDSTQLTFNPGQDYFAAWSEDAQSIVYVFSKPGDLSDDRCLGILPAEGGTLLWRYCEEHATHADSGDSFAAPALSRDGRLLYVQASSKRAKETPDRSGLWLTDTAHPLVRHELVHFPKMIEGYSVDWFGDIRWTGPNSFIVNAQQYVPLPHCRRCSSDDSVFVGLSLMRGDLGDSSVQFTAIPNTTDVSSYSLAEDGTSIILVRHWGLTIERVPLAGGPATVVRQIPAEDSLHILGVGCHRSFCVVAADLFVDKTRQFLAVAQFPMPQGRIYGLDLGSGGMNEMRRGENNAFIAHPIMSPLSYNVVFEFAQLPSANLTPLPNLILFRGVTQ